MISLSYLQCHGISKPHSNDARLFRRKLVPDIAKDSNGAVCFQDSESYLAPWILDSDSDRRPSRRLAHASAHESWQRIGSERSMYVFCLATF